MLNKARMVVALSYLLLFMTSDAWAYSRRYVLLDLGWVAAQDNYEVDYDYIGKYSGYHTYDGVADDCIQCTAVSSGLRERPVLFSGDFNMELSSGFSISGEYGIEIMDSFSIGVEFAYLSKEETAQSAGNVSIDSSLFTAGLNVSYTLFRDTPSCVRPFVAIGLGLAGYSAEGEFTVSGLNSVRGVNNVPLVVRAYGNFDSLTGYSLITQVKVGVLYPMGDNKAVDFGVKYLAMNTITTFGNINSMVNYSDVMTQDPGAAQNPGEGGCNGNNRGFCGVGVSPYKTAPVSFVNDSLEVNGISSGNVIFDFGIKLFF